MQVFHQGPFSSKDEQLPCKFAFSLEKKIHLCRRRQELKFVGRWNTTPVMVFANSIDHQCLKISVHIIKAGRVATVVMVIAPYSATGELL